MIIMIMITHGQLFADFWYSGFIFSFSSLIIFCCVLCRFSQHVKYLLLHYSWFAVWNFTRGEVQSNENTQIMKER